MAMEMALEKTESALQRQRHAMPLQTKDQAAVRSNSRMYSIRAATPSIGMAL